MFADKTIANKTAKVVLPKPKTATTASKFWRPLSLAAAALGAASAAPAEEEGGLRRPVAPRGVAPPAPAAARRLQDGAMQGDGWTAFLEQGVPYHYQVLVLDDAWSWEGATTLPFCKDACLAAEWCNSIDFEEAYEYMDWTYGPVCYLSAKSAFVLRDEGMGEELETRMHNTHYVRPANDTLGGMTRQDLQEFVDYLSRDDTDSEKQTALDRYFFTHKPEILPSRDVSGRTSFRDMFANDARGYDTDTTSWNADLSDWDVAAGTDFSGMFYGASSYNSDLSSWNVAAGKSFSYMFAGTNYNQDLAYWDVDAGTDFSGMFAETRYNQDLSNWNVGGEGTDVRGMFAGSSFNQDVSSWHVHAAGVAGMFQGSHMTDLNYCPCVLAEGTQDDWSQYCPGVEELGSQPCPWDRVDR